MKKVARVLFILFLIPLSMLSAHQYELAICSIFRNEAPYFKEWIEFHKLVGVQHFYLYNNRSTDNFYEVLEPYIKSGEVEVVDWSKHDASDFRHFCFYVQPKAYEDGARRALGKAKWVAFLDTDEYLTPIRCDTVTEVLKNYESQDAIYCNWQMFGTSGVLFLPPNQLTIERFTLKAGPSLRQLKIGKSIIKPESIESFPHAHVANLKAGCHTVDMKENIVHDLNNVGPYYEDLALNHFWSRSEEYCFEDKFVDYVRWHPELTLSHLIQVVAVDYNAVPDTTLKRFVKPLRKKMGLDKK